MKNCDRATDITPKENIKRAILIRLLRAGSYSAVIQISGAALAAFSNILMARSLGAAGFGIFNVVCSLAMFATVPAKLGLDTAIMKFTSQYVETGQWGRLRGLFDTVPKIVILSSIICMVLGYVFGSFLYPGLTLTLPWALPLGLLLVPILSILHLCQYALRGLNAIVMAQVPDAILKPLVTIIALAFLLHFSKSALITPELGIIVQVLSYIIILPVTALALRRSIPSRLQDEIPSFEGQRVLSTGLPLLFISSLYIIQGQLDILMLGSLHGALEAGIYASANRIATLLLIFNYAVSSYVAPQISALYSAGRFAELRHTTRLASRLVCGLTIPLILTVIYWKNLVIHLFGSEFEFAHAPLVILAIAELPRCIVPNSGFLLTMTGHERTALSVMCVAIGINILANVLLIPTYGAVGAAFSTLVSISIMSAGFTLASHKIIYRDRI